MPALSIFENVSTGAIDAGYSWMGYEIGQVPASALFGATPFGLEPADFLAWMYFKGGKELLNETFAPHNVHADPLRLDPARGGRLVPRGDRQRSRICRA